MRTAAILPELVERAKLHPEEKETTALLVNGGAAIAFLSILSTLLQKLEHQRIAVAVLWAIPVLVFGLAFAIGNHHCRRKCSLIPSFTRSMRTKRLESWPARRRLISGAS